MDRKEAAAILIEVTHRKSRPDVPADVVEAIDVALRVLAEDGADLELLVADGACTYLTDEARAVAQKHRDWRRQALERWEAEKAAR